MKNENSDFEFKGTCVTHQNVRIDEGNSSMKFIFTYHTPGGRSGRFTRWPPRKPCISYRHYAVIIQHAILVSNFILSISKPCMECQDSWEIQFLWYESILILYRICSFWRKNVPRLIFVILVDRHYVIESPYLLWFISSL